MNVTYTGCAAYGRRSESKYHALEADGVVRELAEGEVAGKKPLRLADQKRWVVVENAHEPLIDSATWWAANEWREGKSQADGGRARSHEPYLLSGLLYCPRCGYNYVGVPARRRSNGKEYVTRYYVCGNYQRGGDCKRGSVEKNEAESKVLALVSKRLHAEVPEPLLREKIREKLLERQAAGPAPVVDRRAEELLKVEKRLKTIVQDIDLENIGFLNEQLTKLGKRRDELREALEALPAAVAEREIFDIEAAVEEVLELTRRFQELAGSTDPADVIRLREEILPQVTGRIEVHAEENYLLAKGNVTNCVHGVGRGERI